MWWYLIVTEFDFSCKSYKGCWIIGITLKKTILFATIWLLIELVNSLRCWSCCVSGFCSCGSLVRIYWRVIFEVFFLMVNCCFRAFCFTLECFGNFFHHFVNDFSQQCSAFFPRNAICLQTCICQHSNCLVIIIRHYDSATWRAIKILFSIESPFIKGLSSVFHLHCCQTRHFERIFFIFVSSSQRKLL